MPARRLPAKTLKVQIIGGTAEADHKIVAAACAVGDTEDIRTATGEDRAGAGAELDDLVAAAAGHGIRAAALGEIRGA